MVDNRTYVLIICYNMCHNQYCLLMMFYYMLMV